MGKGGPLAPPSRLYAKLPDRSQVLKSLPLCCLSTPKSLKEIDAAQRPYVLTNKTNKNTRRNNTQVVAPLPPYQVIFRNCTSYRKMGLGIIIISQKFEKNCLSETKYLLSTKNAPYTLTQGSKYQLVLISNQVKFGEGGPFFLPLPISVQNFSLLSPLEMPQKRFHRQTDRHTTSLTLTIGSLYEHLKTHNIRGSCRK